jgi:ferric hydroxamate transport system permease protein
MNRALSLIAILAALALSAWNLHAITSQDVPRIAEIVALDSWAPRIVTAWLAGALLGLSGVIFQQVLRNPLAEPMTLGVSAGAQLAMTVATLWMPAWMAIAPQGIALAGACVAALLVFGFAWRSGFAPVTVAVAGLVITLYCGSVGVALQLFYMPYLRGLFIWGGGSLMQSSWSDASMLALRLAIGGALAFTLLRPMTLLSLDDANARALGLPLPLMRAVALALAIVLSAAVVSAVGVIGFVGLAAPALARLAGARRLVHRLILAPSIGALLLWLTDQIVQQATNALGDLVPAGAACALFGAPLMLMLLSRVDRTHRLDVSAAPFENNIGIRMLKRRFVWTALLALTMLALSLDFGRGAQGWHLSTFDELSRVLTWRAPRAIAALSAGIMLAVSGTLLQRLTANPLASPEVLGVSAGASLGMIALVLFFADAGQTARLVATTAGALIALIAILWFASRAHFAPQRVLLAGIAVGALFQAVVAVVIASGGERAAALLNWLAGSTYAITPADAIRSMVLCVMFCAPLPLIARWLDVLPLGDAAARALGVDVRRARGALFALIALLTASATLIVGPLSFVGLTAPHFARSLGARRPLEQALIAAPVGALTMTVADWLGRALTMPRELPAGLVATLIGAPFLMWFLARRR